ncbi:methylmalonyl-CoA mutase subunit beta [Aurantibacter sp.]|uniref:methylmalonyl-CoA mutase subunit beta n=1 Tax=Aurantibacter sp. TaxID=2807103 RepID=UPI003263AA3A
MSHSSLFDDFSEVSAKGWKQKIEADLKGADYEKTLIWHSQEGVSVEPFYHKENSVANSIQKSKNGWQVGQFIEVEIANKANLRALDSIKNGAKSIWFDIISENIDFEILLNAIELKSTNIHIHFQKVTVKNRQSILNFIKNTNNVQFHFDSLGNLAKTGNWFLNENADFNFLKSLLEGSQKNTITVDASLYQNAGATIIQQLAYAMAHANEYLNQNNNNTSKVLFKVAIGSNYFFEIAKIRALRLLWATLASEYELSEECLIMATPTKRNKTLYDYNVNMLRTSTECMSAVLGGADLVCNLPYDVLYHEPNDFGDRIALNQLLILKNESYFDKVDNAAEGAYYIESLTQEIAEKALVLFKNIEESGGFLTQLKSGVIQTEIEKSAEIIQKSFNNSDTVLVGTNKYLNVSDKMKDTIRVSPFVITDYGETSIRPIVEKRLATTIEQKRLDDE